MNARELLVTLALFGGLAACSGGKDDAAEDDTDPGDDDDDDVVPDDSGADSGTNPGPQFFEPAWITVETYFGFDSATGQVVVATADGNEQPNAMFILLGGPGWEADDFSPDSDEYCLIQMNLLGAGAPSGWYADLGLYYGFDYDPTAGYASNCGVDAYAFDPNVIPDPQAYLDGIVSQAWGVGIGVIKPDYLQYIQEDSQAYAIGGYVQSTLLPGPAGMEAYVVFANEMDPVTFELTVEDGSLVSLEAESIYLGDRIATAFYRVLPFFIYPLQ